MDIKLADKDLIDIAEEYEELVQTLITLEEHINGECSHSDVEECNNGMRKIINKAIAKAEGK